MFNCGWEPSAEFFLRTEDIPEGEEIYCLCSRVFIWYNEFSKETGGSENGGCCRRNTDNSRVDFLECADVKNDADELASCYCTASHTDNISTDEHDSLCDLHSTSQQTSKMLHLSDSGTDLSDHTKCNNDSWQHYWALHGERFIWESWISKYSDYINPGYLQVNSNSRHAVPISEQGQLLKDISTSEANEKNQVLAGNLSDSDSYDKLQQECEGWYRLSPGSNECETEAEHLLSSRCPSQTGSLVPTLDSMTNVTQLTLSSVDLSDSSKNSEGFTSVSSIQSSITSSSSVEVDDCTDHSNRWNELWVEHYEEVYLRQYETFIKNKSNGIETIEITKEADSNNLAPDYETTSKTSGTATDEDSQTLHLPADSQKLHSRRCKSKISVLKKRCSSIDEELTTTSVDTVDSLPSSQEKNIPKTTAESTSSNFKQNYSKRIKSVFKLLGVEMHENAGKDFTGSVECQTQHIQTQNRFLKLHKNTKSKVMPKHIRFDDNGDVISESSSQMIEVNEASSSNELLPTPITSNGDELPILIDDEAEPEPKQVKKKTQRKLPSEIEGSPKLIKYWRKRYSLFSKFDKGIKLDTESWFSVTPEKIAIHTAERCRCDVIIDAFCGAGGNSIQFASTCNKVIAIDIDPKKIELAKHNAKIYNVDDRIEFIIGDFFQLASQLQGDVVFLSPPWGGPRYLNTSVYELEELQPQPFSILFETASKISPNIGIYLPRNTNTQPLLMAAAEGGYVEVEQNFLGKKLVAITAYFGELVKDIASD